MKKIIFSTVLLLSIGLAACGETEKPIPEDKTIEDSKPIEKTQKENEEKAKEDAEQVKKEAEEKTLAEQKENEETGDTADKEITENQVKEIIEDSGMDERDTLLSLTIENGEIKAVIDLAPNQFNLPPKDIAISSYSGASDALLKEEGWNTLTIEYVGVGTISMDISEKQSNEFGYYFPSAVITERLK